MLEIDPEIISYVVSLLLAILSLVFGDKYIKYKQKFADSQQLAVKLSAALKATSDAIEDDKITPEEQKTIVEKWKDLIDSAKGLLEVKKDK